MAYSVNKVILLGNLGKDPELAYSGTGTAYCRFSLATNYGIKDKDGNWKNQTDWHSIVTFGKLAESCSQILKKGGKAYIEGRIQYDEYEKDNVKRKSISIIATDVVPIDRRESPDKSDENTTAGSSSATDTSQNNDDDLPF
ncbi:MAG TPA: single-stranded DNA-binding protein [Ignavibacteria bacterium]